MIYLGSHPSKWSFLGTGQKKYSTLNKGIHLRPVAHGHASVNRRNYFQIKIEEFSGVADYGLNEAFVGKEGIETVTFEKGIRAHQLKKGAPCHMLVEPGMFDRENSDLQSHVACGDGYLAVHSRGDFFVHVFTLEEKNPVSSYEIQGEILKLVIKDNILFVSARESTLKAFDLKAKSKDPLFEGPMYPTLCFGKQYLLYSEDDQSKVYAQKLNGKGQSFQVESSAQGIFQHYFFANDDHFIKVLDKGNVLDVVKIHIENDQVTKTMLKADLEMPSSEIYFHEDRVIALNRTDEAVEFSAYDINTGKIQKIYSIQEPPNRGGDRKADLLSEVKKIYYFVQTGSELGLNMQLTTIQFDESRS